MHRMRHGSLIAGLLIGIVLGPRSSEAQYNANFQTNIISSVTSNWSGNYLVGSNTFADALLIQNSGVLSNGIGYLGYEVNSSNNSALVTDPGSIWSNRSALIVGWLGAGNSVVISNGGRLVSNPSPFNGSGYLGYNSSSSNNHVLVTGTNSVWNMNGFLQLGRNGADNMYVGGQ